MKFKRRQFAVSAALAFAWMTVGAVAPGPQLVRKAGTDALDGVADQTHGVMKWSHGAFLYKEVGTQPPSFYTLDREGQVISSGKLSIPGAAQFMSTGFDRGADGSIVFAGGAYSSDGQAAPFIAWISTNGQTERVVRTAPYHAYMLSVAPDGTVWTIGCEMINHDTKAPGVNRDAGALRHFDSAGRVIGSALPQSQFRTSQERSRMFSGLLVATGSRLGWYAPREGSGEYAEISTETMAVQEFPGAPLSASNGDMATGLALTEAGVVTVSVQDKSPGVRSTYSLDRARSKWVRLDVPAMGGYKFAPHLMGSDGEDLVFQYGHSAAFFALSR